MSEMLKKLPYCVQKIGPQKFQVFNRNYEILGEPFFARISEDLQRKISFNGKTFSDLKNGFSLIFLYNDNLKVNKKWPEKYLERLQVLLEIKSTGVGQHGKEKKQSLKNGRARALRN